MRKFFQTFLFNIKNRLSPYKTIIKYPHVKIMGNVILVDCKIGKEVKIYDKSKLSNCNIGNYSYVGGNCKIMNANIGSFCSLGPNLKIGLGIHPVNFVSTYPGFYSKNATGCIKLNEEEVVEHKKIVIKNDVWIGDSVTIIDGVKIGNGAILATGAVVTKDVPDYAIVGGVPAKIIKYRFDENEIDKLKKIRWWDDDISIIKEKAKLFLSLNDFFNKYK